MQMNIDNLPISPNIATFKSSSNNYVILSRNEAIVAHAYASGVFRSTGDVYFERNITMVSNDKPVNNFCIRYKNPHYNSEGNLVLIGMDGEVFVEV